MLAANRVHDRAAQRRLERALVERLAGFPGMVGRDHLVVPRPIALTTTVDAEGRVNAAPFSFFNAVSSRPPVVVLGISPGGSGDGGYKDTERNIRDTGEFVVNLVDEAIAERMNVCDVGFPTGVNELEMAGLHPVASAEVK